VQYNCKRRDLEKDSNSDLSPTLRCEMLHVDDAMRGALPPFNQMKVMWVVQACYCLEVDVDLNLVN
jgi:hypothetical protein